MGAFDLEVYIYYTLHYIHYILRVYFFNYTFPCFNNEFPSPPSEFKNLFTMGTCWLAGDWDKPHINKWSNVLTIDGAIIMLTRNKIVINNNHVFKQWLYTGRCSKRPGELTHRLTNYIVTNKCMHWQLQPSYLLVMHRWTSFKKQN